MSECQTRELGAQQQERAAQDGHAWRAGCEARVRGVRSGAKRCRYVDRSTSAHSLRMYTRATTFGTRRVFLSCGR